MAPRKVFASSSGEYSDYKVAFLFEQREDAEAHAARPKDDENFPRNDCFVEEFWLYSPGQQPRYVDEWSGFIDLEPGTTTIPEPRLTNWPRELHDQDVTTRRPEVEDFKVQTGTHHIRARGADREAVIKALKDRAAGLLAAVVP